MITVVLGMLTQLVMGLLMKSKTLDDLSTIIKQIIVVIIAAIANLIRIKMGYDVPQETQAYVVQTIMTAISSLGVYNLYKSHTAAGTT